MLFKSSLNPARQRIFTEADLYDHKELQLITECADQILSELEETMQDENISLLDVELVLELVPWNDEVICGYYFVEHNSRCLFWLHEFDAESLCGVIKVVVSLSHLRKSGFQGLRCARLIIFDRLRDREPVLVGDDIWKGFCRILTDSPGHTGNYFQIFVT